MIDIALLSHKMFPFFFHAPVIANKKNQSDQSTLDIPIDEIIKTNYQQLLKNSSLKESIKNRLAVYQTGKELDDLLKLLFDEKIIHQPQLMFNVLKELLTKEQLEILITFKAKSDATTFLQRAKIYSSLIHRSEEKESFKQMLFNHWKKDGPVFVSYILNLINLFVDTLDFMNVNKNNISLWDRQLLLFIICKFIAIPGLVIQALTPFLGTRPKVYVVAYSAIILIGFSVYVYQKWLRPHIDELSNAANMKKLFKKKKFKRRVIKRTTIKQVVHHVKNNHLMLVGLPGTGKTAIPEALAQLAVEEKINSTKDPILPKEFREIEIFDVNGKALASQYNKVEPFQKLKSDLENCGKQTILVINEAHALLNHPDCLEAIKIFLDQKGIKCIGTTNPSKYEEIKKDEALRRRWPELEIKSANQEETEFILLGVYQEREEEIFKQTGIRLLIQREALKKIAENSILAFPNEAQPAKAIDCLEELMTRCQMAYSSTYFSTKLENDKDAQQLEIERQRVNEDMEPVSYVGRQEMEVEVQEVESKKKSAKSIQEWRKKELACKNECAHIGNKKNFESDQDLQTLYALNQYYVIPKFQELIEIEVEKWKGKMDLKINEDLITRGFEGKIPKPNPKVLIVNGCIIRN
jgi:Cdc6-like AAA superfamily ATPase